MGGFLLYIWQILVGSLQSNYKFLVVLFFLLLYRIEFMPDTGVGFAKILQVITLVGIVYYLFLYCPKIFTLSFSRTNGAIKSCLLLYLFAVCSVIWAFNAQFALFLSAQNLILILLFVWFFSLFDQFYSMERAFVMLVIVLQLFEFVCLRLGSLSFWSHFLPGGSIAALALSYCAGEYMNMKDKNEARTTMLMSSIIISAINLVLCTSGGANAAAVFGIGVAMFFGKNRLYSILLLAIGIFLFFNRELIDNIILTLMPGKDLATIENGNGRDAIWSAICESVASRPVFGWGFACAERTVQDVIQGQILSDAHNSYVGIYGGLGYIGCVLLGIHLLRTGWEMISRIAYPGYVGLLSAFACACLNMYTYGFLSGKACSITMVYFMLVSLTYHYRRVWV